MPCSLARGVLGMLFKQRSNSCLTARNVQQVNNQSVKIAAKSICGRRQTKGQCGRQEEIAMLSQFSVAVRVLVNSKLQPYVVFWRDLNVAGPAESSAT